MGGGESPRDTFGSGLCIRHPSEGLNPHESVHDLRDFLKVACPHWSHFNGKGVCNINQVMAKLKSIGVTDYWDLMQRVDTNTINEDLYAAGKVVFKDRTLNQFRQQKSFLSALENLRAPYYRQTGAFAPVPQMLSKQSLWSQAKAMNSHHTTSIGDTRSLSEPRLRSTRRPGSAAADLRRKREAQQEPSFLSDYEDGISFASDMRAAAGRRPASTPSGVGSGSVVCRPSLRYTRTGKEHQCWTKEHEADDEEAARQPNLSTPGALRSTQSFDTSVAASRRASAMGIDCDGEVSPWALEEQAKELDAQARNYRKTGFGMSSSSSSAKWSNLTHDTLLAQGEAMLQEQHHMDERRKVEIAMKREGPNSTTRKIVTSNIRKRMKDEAGNAGILDCHYHIGSIRKNLKAMANARNELANVKRSAMLAAGDDPDRVDFGLFLKH